MTVNDPKAYTKLRTLQLTQTLMLDSELLDYICLEERIGRTAPGGK